MALIDKNGKARFVYHSPLVYLPSNKTTTIPLEFDAGTSSLHITLPVLFPLIIAFGLSTKIPDAKGGFGFGFPSFKFGSKGDIEESSESEDEEPKAKSRAVVDVPAPKTKEVKEKKSGKFKVLLALRLHYDNVFSD